MRAVAQDHEMLDELCRRTTGATADVVEATLAANPGLAMLGPRLPAGTVVQIVVPPKRTKKQAINLWD
jgi:phage tail protein X